MRARAPTQLRIPTREKRLIVTDDEGCGMKPDERDKALVDPVLINIAQVEATRLKRALLLNSMDAKDVYRSMIEVAAQYRAALRTNDEGAA